MWLIFRRVSWSSKLYDVFFQLELVNKRGFRMELTESDSPWAFLTWRNQGPAPLSQSIIGQINFHGIQPPGCRRRHLFKPVFGTCHRFFVRCQIYVLCRHRHLAGPKMVSWMVSGAAVPLPGPGQFQSLCVTHPANKNNTYILKDKQWMIGFSVRSIFVFLLIWYLCRLLTNGPVFSCLFSGLHGLHENFPEVHDNPDDPHLVPVRNALKSVCFNISSLVSILWRGRISKGAPFYRWKTHLANPWMMWR